MNNFANTLNSMSSMGYTENGATKYTTTDSRVYDLFALGGAYRTRSNDDKIKLFMDAFKENPELALKCLYYLRDVRGGQGERELFRVCLTELFKTAFMSEDVMMNLLTLIPYYGRWDDLFYLYGKVSDVVDKIIINIIDETTTNDLHSFNNINLSLIGKWLPSENASSMSSRYLARQFAKKLGISYKEYRKMLSTLREKINVLERLMSANKWDEIEFDKLPSKAGLKYSKAFMTRPETGERYYRFMHSDTTKVNSKTLYPYEIVQKCMSRWEYTDDEVLQKYWENLPNYFGDDEKSAICVVDVSGSMSGTPMSVSISLGIYCAERLNGPFKDLFITFSENPKVEKLKGKKITTRVNNMESANWGYNTNLKAVFDLLLDIAKKPGVKPEDIPQSLIIISDMEIDSATSDRGCYYSGANYHKPSYMSDMEFIRKQWEDAGFKMPHLIYWNVNARNDTILDKGDNITCVSGLSASTFEMILSGKTGIDVMLDKLMSERYVPVHF